MTYAKRKKMILLCCRRSQSVGENQQDELEGSQRGTRSLNEVP